MFKQFQFLRLGDWGKNNNLEVFVEWYLISEYTWSIEEYYNMKRREAVVVKVYDMIIKSPQSDFHLWFVKSISWLIITL